MKMRSGKNIARAGLAGLVLALCLAQGAYPDAGSPGAIFDFGAGARPLAMGGAYSAMVKEASSLYYNPAGLSMLGNRNISFMRATLFEGMSYDYLGYAQNYGGFPGGWGVQLLRLSAGTADGRDENNQPAGSFSYNETAFAVGTGVHGLFLPTLSLGASIKVLNRSLADETSRLAGFDIGAQYSPALADKLTLGLVLRNFGNFAMGNTDDKLPVGLKAGGLRFKLQYLRLRGALCRRFFPIRHGVRHGSRRHTSGLRPQRLLFRRRH